MGICIPSFKRIFFLNESGKFGAFHNIWRHNRPRELRVSLLTAFEVLGSVGGSHPRQKCSAETVCRSGKRFCPRVDRIHVERPVLVLKGSAYDSVGESN
ncbi:hypothetical protein AVEN_121432-1 [Araneus ventricosus]|uniref:Uncharacterized protein n=1 Tax=Araneus ventricosus TaxID=182803 RepID=A0A4Y2DL58_ARAVE|nr:hypothetical protein AVEN_121432-1 [Araneus ventricosus]